MYKAFHITNTRCIRDLELQDLKAVNLIVGENNTGKTTVLKAIASNHRKTGHSSYLPLRDHRNVTLSNYWKTLERTGWDYILKREILLERLQLIEERVEAVFFWGCDKLGVRSPNIKLKGLDEPVPLESLGGGFNAFFDILLTLLTRESGDVILIDGIDGFHPLFLPQVWECIFGLDKDIQIFVASVNPDILPGFAECWEKYPEMGSLRRLEWREDRNLKEVRYSLEELVCAIDLDLAVV